MVGLSPIIGGAHVRGMADQLLPAIGVEVSAAAVGLHYGARTDGGLLDGWLVDEADAGARGRRRDRRARLPRRTADDDRPDATAAMAAAALELVATMSDGPGASPPTACRRCRPGDDLVALLLAAGELADGDVVAVTSKVVSKAEGRVRAGTPRGRPGRRDRPGGGPPRGARRIVRTHHGLTLAAAGIDASNVEPGRVVLLPVGPRRVRTRAPRTRIRERTGRNVAVVVTDTAGRAWREGQTDIAIGAAGLQVLEDYAGRVDAHGNELAVTAPAVADEIAGAAELAQGKLGGRPFAVVRGRADLVLPPGDDGPGAAALVRPDGADMFGYGAREAVLARAPRRRRRHHGVRRPGRRRRPGRGARVRLGRVTDSARDGDTVRCRPETAARRRPSPSRLRTVGSRLAHTTPPKSGSAQSVRRLCPRHRPDAPRKPIRGQARQDRTPSRSSTRSARSRRAPRSAADS